MDDNGLVRSGTYQFFSESFKHPPVMDDGEPFVKSESYLQAFDPSVSKSACSLQESDYVTSDRSSTFESLVRMYSFFGLSRADNAELPDHISVELEFMHYLTYIESKTDRNSEAFDGIQRAQYDFVTRHLSKLVTGIFRKKNKIESSYYRQLLKDLVAFLESEEIFLETQINELDYQKIILQ